MVKESLEYQSILRVYPLSNTIEGMWVGVWTSIAI